MLAQLLSSKTKGKLVSLFIAHPGRSFSATELRLATGTSTKVIAQTIRELSKIGFLLIHKKDRTKYYQIDKHFALFPELVSMLRKIKTVPSDLMVKAAARAGSECKYVCLTGLFAGRPRMETDVLFVGKLSPKRLSTFLKFAEKLAEREISYTVFSPQEFDYRQIMNDMFVKNILDNDPVVVLDKTRKRTLVKVGKK